MKDEARAVRLSICIATYKRATYIGDTLASFLPTLPAGVEVLIVDGASPDNTRDVVEAYQANYPRLAYFREDENSGVDGDYDKAVSYAQGEFCWLLTDDDVLVPGAVERVLDALDGDVDLVVVNAEVRTADLSRQILTRIMHRDGETEYGSSQADTFFAEAGQHLSFIGAVVIRRTVWLSRERRRFYGTLFVHFGVIFQNPPITAVRVIREPLIVIRYGNAMWTARGFEIWAFKWPGLVWSFNQYSEVARRVVTHPAPYRSVSRLMWFRAIGAYSPAEYAAFIQTRSTWCARLASFLVAVMPGQLANGIFSAYLWLGLGRSSPMQAYDLARSRYVTCMARSVAVRKGVL